MTTASTYKASRWSALTTLPTRILTALADHTRDWRRGCGL
jgi:hypothetical protein